MAARDISEEALPLSELYTRGAQISLETESSSGRQDEAARQRAVQLLQRCEHQVESLSLFSMNEEEADISTGDLKYLLVAFHLGILLSATPENDPSARSEWLQKANNAFARFLRLCKAYQLVPKSALVDEDQDPHTKRAMKIQRYKDLNVSRAALFALQAMAARKRQVGPSDADESNNDEENERKIWTKQIAMAALQAVDQQDHLKKELELLAYASTLPQSEREKPLPAPPADVLEKLQLAASNLGSQREQIAADVFKPSHRLPTRTLKQQAEIEVEQAKSAAERQTAAEKLKKELESDEDYVLAKARAWDDWKDDHQRGEGNSKLRPTA